MSDRQIEAGARALARDEWRVYKPTEDEADWVERNWPAYVDRATLVLRAANGETKQPQGDER